MTKHNRSTRITAQEAGPDEGSFTESAYGYNPIFQKRVTLGLDRTPGGGYHYYGPPPDAGTSYGSWIDPANKVGAIAPVTADGVTMFSPLSGAEMQYEGPANADMKDAVISFSGDFHLMPASRSGHACLTSAPIYGDYDCPAMFNPFTGEDVTEEYHAMKTTKKTPAAVATAAEGGSAQKGFSPKTITVPKIGQKVMPFSQDGNSMKPVDNSSADSKKDGLNKATNPHGSDEPDKEKTVKQSSIKPAGNVKVPDVGMDSLPHASGSAKPAVKAAKSVESMTDDELVEALEAHLAQADGDGSVPKLEIELSPEDMGEHQEGGEMPPLPPPEGSEMPPEGMPPAESMGMPPPGMPPPAGGPPPAASDLDRKNANIPGVPPPVGGPNPAPEHSEQPMHSGDPAIPVLESPEEEHMGMGMPYAQVALVKKLRAAASAMRAGVKIDKADQDALMAEAARVMRANQKRNDESVAADDFTEFLKQQAVSKDPTTAAIMQGLKSLHGTVTTLAQKVDAITNPAPKAAKSAAPAAKPVAADKAPPFEKKEDKDDEKVEEIMDDKKDKAEGVHFEVLQSLDDLEKEGITAASVQCSLYAESGVNPFWNITVHGEPLARIYLQDQDRPDEIKAVFTSAAYGEAVSKASEQVQGGLRQLLADANARFFTLQLDKVEVAQNARDVATAEAKKLITEKLTTLSDRFLESMATAAIGMDRNFFPGGNPLKLAISLNLQKLGLPVAQAIEVIEASFSDGSADYFKALATKATDLMSMEPVAFDQVRASILQSGTIMPVVGEEAPAPIDAGKSMVQHLVEASNSIAGVNMSIMGGDNEQLSEKEQLRRDLGFPSRR